VAGTLLSIVPRCKYLHVGFFGGNGMSARREQISVTLDPDLRIFAEQVAAREDRTLAG
jgi:hypothetical protein